MNVLGERIYRLRKDADVSQEKLGEALNVSRHTVSRWETGLTKPSAENLKCLCVYFGVAGNYFFGDGENRGHDGSRDRDGRRSGYVG